MPLEPYSVGFPQNEKCLLPGNNERLYNRKPEVPPSGCMYSVCLEDQVSRGNHSESAEAFGRKCWVLWVSLPSADRWFVSSFHATFSKNVPWRKGFPKWEIIMKCVSMRMVNIFTSEKLSYLGIFLLDAFYSKLIHCSFPRWKKIIRRVWRLWVYEAMTMALVLSLIKFYIQVARFGLFYISNK